MPSTTPSHHEHSPIEYEKPQSTSHASSPFCDSPSQIATATGGAGPTFLSRLSQFPAHRALPWRLGQELPPERSIESERVQQRGASLLATRGDVAESPCSQCAVGRGRFTDCISLGNWFQGACANCVFTSRGNRCSLRLARGKVDGRSARHQPVEEGGMNENPNPRPRKKRRETSENQPAIAHFINHPQVQAQERSHHPVVSASSPQTVSLYMDASLREKAVEEKRGLLGLEHDMEKKQKSYQTVSAGFHDPASIIQKPLRDHLPYLMGGYGGFTAVNETSRPPKAIQQAPQIPSQTGWPQPASGNLPVGAPMQSPLEGGEPVPLIDTLPKAKQRQIFGLISGIQGGIDHLQKELSLLQGTLGIEIESQEKDI